MKHLLSHIRAKLRKLIAIEFSLCSDCFRDQGLRLDASRIGIETKAACQNCHSTTGRKLSNDLIGLLAHRFFVWGTLYRGEYGAAPVVQFNDVQPTSISTSPWFESDLRLIEKAIGVGFFYYGPRLWMLGQVEPLMALQDQRTRASIVDRIIAEYSEIRLAAEQKFFRIRKSPAMPSEFAEYDSPPPSVSQRRGRLDSERLSVLYGSQDLQVCIHECRVTAEDDIYVATLAPTNELRLLDLTELLSEEDVTEFESLDMAVHMLFLAGEHSYEISRDIALAVHFSGFDGLVYPSYFSLLRTGAMPFPTTFGISHRRFPQRAGREKSKTIPNLALFGRPIEQDKIRVQCINKVILTRVDYDFHFGPVGHEPPE